VRAPNTPNGLIMEHLLAYMLNLELVKDERQYTHDADLEHPTTKELYSVKYQARAAQTGNISFETKLINSSTGKEMPGNFVSNKTERYIIVVPDAFAPGPDLVPDIFRAYEFVTKDLHPIVVNPRFRRVRLNQAKANNVGRAFDDAENVLVPRKILSPFVKSEKLFSYQALLENDRVQEFLKKTGYGKRRR
jgi:hypothetical protein